MGAAPTPLIITPSLSQLDTELAGLANNYFDILKCALPLLLAPREYENSIASEALLTNIFLLFPPFA